MFLFFKQKTADEVRISDWSSDVCSSDLVGAVQRRRDAFVCGKCLHGGLLAKVPDIDEMAGDGGGGGHRRAYQMRAPALALAAFEITIRGRGAAFPRFEAIRVHGQAHRATRFAPLKPGVQEYLVQPLFFRLHFDQARSRDPPATAHPVRYEFDTRDQRRGAQPPEAGIRTSPDTRTTVVAGR